MARNTGWSWGWHRSVIPGRWRREQMSTFTLEVQLPEALHELGFGDEEICREVPTLLVMKRFREGAISSGKAARILGITRREFLARLAREGIPVYDPMNKELTQELETLRSLTIVRP